MLSSLLPILGEPLALHALPALPQLLVSVRSPQEALDALSGGAGILDIKEPANGPLGMATLHDLYLICATAKATASTAISAALGEVLDWQHAPLPPLPPHLQYAKLGLAGLALEPHWRVLWKQLRSEFDILRGQPLDWVAVAYADADRAQSPSVREVLQAAIEDECRALLIDTFDKSGGRLVDLLPTSELQAIVAHAHAHQVAVAFAGRVTSADLPSLSQNSSIRSGAARPEANHKATHPTTNHRRLSLRESSLHHRSLTAPLKGLSHAQQPRSR